MARGGALLLAAVALAFAVPGRAAGADGASGKEDQARALFQQGNQLVERGNYVDALDKFRAAYRVWQNPKIKLNIATTLRELGRNAEALDSYQQYMREADPTPQLAEEVRGVITELEARVAKVTIAVDGEASKLLLDGRDVPLEKRAEAVVDPGRHTLVVEHDGPPHIVTFDVQAGEQRVLDVALADAPEVPARAPDDDRSAATAFRVRPEGHAGPGLYLRGDVDTRGRGAVAGFGLSWATSSHFNVTAGGLAGASYGLQVGARLSPFRGPLRPTLGVSMPVFFAGSPVFGVSGELGLRQALSRSLFVSVQGAIVHFVNAPENYESTVLVPSAAVELRL